MEQHGQLLFGLRWETTLSDALSEREGLARIDKANAFVEYRFDVSSKVGFATRLKKIKGLYSAAAVFASTAGADTAVFIHDFPGGRTGLIIVKGFLPTTDVVISRPEAVALLNDFIAHAIDSGTPVKVHGDLRPEESRTTSITIQSKSLAELDSLAKKSKYELKSIGRDYTIPLLVIGIFAIAGIAAVVLDFDTSEIQPKQEKDPKVQHKEQIAVLVKNISESHTFPSQVVERFMTFANDVTWKLPGWELDVLTCRPFACTATYNRLDGGTARGFLNTLKIQNVDTTVNFPNLDHVARELSYAADTQNLPLQLTQLNSFNKSILSWFQGLKDVGYEDSTFTPPNFLLAAPPNVQVDKEDAIRTGTFKMTIPYDELRQASKIPNYMTVTLIEARLVTVPNKKVLVKMEGNYYAY